MCGDPAAEPVTARPIRVLVADDKEITRNGLRDVINSRPGDGIVVVGEAATGVEVLEQCAVLDPDVVIMDLVMPEMNGIEATTRLRHRHPRVAVLVFSVKGEDHWVGEAIRAGARGYLLKDADEDDMLHAIRAVGKGEAIFSPAVARRVIDFLTGTRSEVERAVPARAFPELTTREREVLDLIAQGLSNPQIAARLYLSPKTVRNHISNIFAKLQVADRAQAIVRARKAGLG